jgi:pimeloyl-ACP methyl ester carboxylesterase
MREERSSTVPATNPARRPGATRGYVPVNGLEMYYEIHGDGAPLALVHGALGTIDSCFADLLPALAAARQVVAIELQGHGHTADADRPLSYPQLAADTAAALDALGIGKADAAGYSLGGAVALELAMQHPGRVRRVVFAGWPDEALQNLAAPVLLIIGDSDIVRPEHTMQMFRLLGGGVIGDLAGLPAAQLAVLPGTSHVGLLDRVDWLQSMILEFLGSPEPRPLVSHTAPS